MRAGAEREHNNGEKLESVREAGIKMECLLYCPKDCICGPEFGVKEESVTEMGRQLFRVHA